MKRFFPIAVLSLLLSACGVSSSQKEKATADFKSKVTGLYLRLGVPAVVESVELSDFEKGDGMVGHGSFHSRFSMTLATDDGSVFVFGDATFDKDGRLVWTSDSTMAAFVLALSSGRGSLPVSGSPYLIKEFAGH